MGFVGSALGSGGAKLIFDCLWRKATASMSPLKTFTCSGRTYQAYTASMPAGCTESIDITTDVTYTQHIKSVMKDIYSIDLMPNAFKSSLYYSVVNDINFVIQNL